METSRGRVPHGFINPKRISPQTSKSLLKNYSVREKLDAPVWHIGSAPPEDNRGRFEGRTRSAMDGKRTPSSESLDASRRGSHGLDLQCLCLLEAARARRPEAEDHLLDSNGFHRPANREAPQGIRFARSGREKISPAPAGIRPHAGLTESREDCQARLRRAVSANSSGRNRRAPTRWLNPDESGSWRAPT